MRIMIRPTSMSVRECNSERLRAYQYRNAASTQRAAYLPVATSIGKLPTLDSCEPRTQPAPRFICAENLSLAASALYVVVGLVACASIDPLSVDASACFPVARSGEQAVAHVSMGPNFRVYELMIRSDAVYSQCRKEDLFHVRMASAEAIYSSTVDCEGDVCSDLVLIRRSSSSRTVRAIVSFVSTSTESTLASALGLDGEIFACNGTEWTLSSHHLCASPHSGRVGVAGKEEEECSLRAIARDPTSIGAAQFTAEGALTLHTDRASLRAAGTPWSSFPAASSGLECNSTDSVDLFPAFASLHGAWIVGAALRVNPTLHDQSHIFAAREAGLACYSQQNKRAVDVIRIGCGVGGCMFDPAVTFFRVSNAKITMVSGVTPLVSGVCVHAAPIRALQEVGHSSPADEQSSRFDVSIVVAKLVVMFFAAAVVWTQNDSGMENGRFTDVHLVHCLRGDKDAHVHRRTLEEMLIELTALVIRVAVMCTQIDTLFHVGLASVGAVEVVACSTGLVQLVFRIVSNYAWWPKLLPLDFVDLLGGPTSVVHVSCAAMLVFARQPLYDTNTTFDEVARLLIAILIAVVCLPRVVFRISCVGRIAVEWGCGMAVWGACHWLVQTTSLAISFSVLFASPFVLHTLRSVRAHVTLTLVAFFVASTTIGAAPRITGMSKALVEASRKDGRGEIGVEQGRTRA